VGEKERIICYLAIFVRKYLEGPERPRGPHTFVAGEREYSHNYTSLVDQGKTSEGEADGVALKGGIPYALA